MKKNQTNNIFYKISEAKWFQRTIIGVILIAALLAGIETYPAIHEEYLRAFRISDITIQIIFTAEIIIRILAFGKRPQDFFKSGANVFDFVITAIFYVPIGGAYAAVLRLARIIRVLRLITAIPRLQMLVGALVKSFPSMGYIALLLFLQMYIFAVLGNFLFGKTDPEHFGNLGLSLLTLFQIITLEGWVDIMLAQPLNLITILYFIGFILLGTMIVLNLFIGVVLNGFEEVKQEIEDELRAQGRKNTAKEELTEISMQLTGIKKRIDSLSTLKNTDAKGTRYGRIRN